MLEIMNGQLTLLFARSSHQDLLGRAGHARLAAAAAHGDTKVDPITVRIATDRDEPELSRLAALDSSERLHGSTLIGELERRPVAALSLSGGKVIADPFVATAEVVDLLRIRARQLADPRRPAPASRAAA
jgi:hypothetical protein